MNEEQIKALKIGDRFLYIKNLGSEMSTLKIKKFNQISLVADYISGPLEGKWTGIAFADLSNYVKYEDAQSKYAEYLI